MDINEIMEVLGEQPIVGCAGTIESDVFDKILEEYGNNNKLAATFCNATLLMNFAYNFGYMQGKRGERKSKATT
ncbi:MAG: hypothetical protein ACERKZ_20670 [Lachnotalea sp.]